MATNAEYAQVARALTVAVRADIASHVPGWAQGMIPPDTASALAAHLARIAIDTLDAYRLSERK